MLKRVYTEFVLLYMSKREAKKLMTDSNLFDKKGVLWTNNYLFFCYKKMDNTSYYQRNRDIALNKAKSIAKMIMKD